ncbi:MAG: prolyl-tRNA synthetase [Candidatus Parcubacteria bacterium]|nr:prolyl-tRNA synthetase [Candidatus Paceibacterota bacterium]
MKLSRNFTRTTKDIPSDEVSKNAQLLIKAGFIHKTMAGVYSYLPLGLRVINKIENIIRENLDQIGGQEVLMNSLHPKEWWLKTDRWDADKVDVLFRLQSQTKSEYALACSHEEQVTPIAKDYIKSFKDLPLYTPETMSDEILTNSTYPLAIYQIQTKFRDELRSKSGIMRGREFRMKDMYDFHQNQESADSYYEVVKQKYFEIYQDLGLKAYSVHATGGMFTDNDSHEFQVVCDAGEDVIYYNNQGYAINEDIREDLIKRGEQIPEGLTKAKSAEVGNIFKLGDKYTQAFDLKFTDTDNTQKYPIMNCHGIGTSRCMGVIAELHSDEKGLKWPLNVAPYQVHLITHLGKDEEINRKILAEAEAIYSGIGKQVGDVKIYAGEVLWDDRDKLSLGVKFADADLIGCPVQIVITERTIASGEPEVRVR